VRFQPARVGAFSTGLDKRASTDSIAPPLVAQGLAVRSGVAESLGSGYDRISSTEV
jgi:hypothetical protein